MHTDDPNHLVMGHWATICCEQDLKQISTQEDIEYFSSLMIEDGFFVDIWPTQSEALSEIKSWYRVGAEEITKIDEVLSIL